jgi:hypothetical protein
MKSDRDSVPLYRVQPGHPGHAVFYRRHRAGWRFFTGARPRAATSDFFCGRGSSSIAKAMGPRAGGPRNGGRKPRRRRETPLRATVDYGKCRPLVGLFARLCRWAAQDAGVMARRDPKRSIRFWPRAARRWPELYAARFCNHSSSGSVPPPTVELISIDQELGKRASRLGLKIQLVTLRHVSKYFEIMSAITGLKVAEYHPRARECVLITHMSQGKKRILRSRYLTDRSLGEALRIAANSASVPGRRPD